MAFDLALIDPSQWIEFRDNWIEESGLQSVGADKLFEEKSLAELIELSGTELKEYAKDIGLTISERRKFRQGINRLKGSNNPITSDDIDPISFPSMPLSKTPSRTPTRTRSKSPSINSRTRSKSKNNLKSSSKKKNSKKKKPTKRRKKSRNKSLNSSLPSPIKTSVTPRNWKQKSIVEQLKDEGFFVDDNVINTCTSTTATTATDRDINMLGDLASDIHNGMNNLTVDAEKTKDEIRHMFCYFKQKLTERELKLIKDVDVTVIKKKRLLQTQLDYVGDNGHQNGINELAVDPNISLLIEKDDILRCLSTAGYIQGALSDDKEEEKALELERKRRELTRQQFLTVEKLKQVTIFERDCASKREISIKLQSEVKADIKKIEERTIKCQSELAVAKPLLEEAEKLVSSINKKQLNEIRVLKKPPFVLELVMSAVVTLLGNKIKTWKDVTKCLADNKFVQSILNFNTNLLTKKIRKQVKKYSTNVDFNVERANKASRIAGPLVKWVKSQMRYSELLDIVRPMQKEIKLLKKTLTKKQKLSKQCIENVKELEYNISKCRTDINDMVENMISLQEKYNFKDECPVAYAVVKHQMAANTNLVSL